MALPPTKFAEGASSQDAYSILNKYRARDDGQAFAAIGLDYAIWMTAACVSELVTVYLSGRRSLVWATYAVSILVIASRLRAFENLVHEASHLNLFQHTRDHHKWQFLYAFPVFKVLDDYRRLHMEHHKHLGDAANDPDMQRILDLGLDKFQARPIWLLFGLPLTGYLTFEWLRDTFVGFWLSKTTLVPKTAYWLLVAYMIYALDCIDLLVRYYAIPLLAVLPTMRYWAEAAEHVGLDMRSQYGHSRSNLGFIHKWCMNPHHDGYHTVHHIHSQVPFHALEVAHMDLTAAHFEFRNNAVVSNGVIETLAQMLGHRTIWKTAAAHRPSDTRELGDAGSKEIPSDRDGSGQDEALTAGETALEWDEVICSRY